MQSIHTAKHFADSTQQNVKKSIVDPDQSAASTKHGVIQEITAAITEQAKDAIIEVLQGSPVKTFKSSTPDSKHEQLELQRTIERSLGVTALSMAKDPMLSGNIALKNELREEMGGTPSSILNATQESVGQYRVRLQQGNASTSTKCSRTFRNNLVDLCSSEEDVKTAKSTISRKTKMKKRVLLKLLKMYKDEKDAEVKNRIKVTMKSLDSKNEKYNSEMLDFVLDVHTSDIESFDSNDAATSLLDFADED